MVTAIPQSADLAWRHIQRISSWYITCRWLIALALLVYSAGLFLLEESSPLLSGWGLGIPLSAALATAAWLLIANAAVYSSRIAAGRGGAGGHAGQRVGVRSHVIIDWLALSLLILMTGTAGSMELVYAFLAHGVLCANVLRRRTAVIYVIFSVLLVVALAAWLVLGRRCDPAATGSRALFYTFLLLLLFLTQLRIRGMREDAYRALQATVDTLRAMNRERIKFLASATHHMKAPLAVISNYLQLFLDGYLVPDSGKAKTIMVDMQERCHGAMDHLVDVLRLTNLDARVLVEDAFTSFVADSHLQAVLSRCGAPQRVTSDLPQGLTLYGIPEHFEIMLEHVLDNALQYSSPDSPVLLQARADAAGVAFAVENRGLGIEATQLRKIFEPYFRGKQAASINQPGSGLGLSICAKIADLHGFSISVDSQPQGVTRFAFTWPVTPADAGG